MIHRDECPQAFIKRGMKSRGHCVVIEPWSKMERNSLTCDQIVSGMKIETIVTKAPGKLELLELDGQH